MPKSKTHSGTAKRFKVSGSGKILRQKAGRRHLLEHKPSTRHSSSRRRGSGRARDAPRIKRLLGI